MTDSLTNFCQKINYKFKNIALLIEAITHPSLAKSHRKKNNYERLEFLGDKVLGLIIGEFLIKKFTDEKEGSLSKRQASLVSGATLSKIALEIGLNEIIIVSKGEENLGGKTNKNNLENSLEAIIGAIYLDSNLENTKEIILNLWQEYLEKNSQPPQDPVSKLQEITQLQTKQLPKYQIEKIGGLDHEPIFIAKLTIPNLSEEFIAKGKSKKEAQKNVSEIALKKLV